MPCILKVNPSVSSADLNALFASAWPGRRGGAVQPMLQRALVYVCAYEGKRLVGFAKVVGDGGVHGFLLDPTVAPDRQRKGIGRRLVAKCAAESRRRGVEWLHVDFEPSLAMFYRACGFTWTQAGLRNLKKVGRNPRPAPAFGHEVTYERRGFLISTEPALLDLDFIGRELNRTYWAKGRPRAVMEEAMRHSICFGVYHKPTRKQVGFARVVTDQATFSWLCDVVIAEAHRRKGLGKWLVSCVTAHPSVRNTVSLLGTLDAHGLYEQFGYVRTEQMKRLPKK